MRQNEREMVVGHWLSMLSNQQNPFSTFCGHKQGILALNFLKLFVYFQILFFNIIYLFILLFIQAAPGLHCSMWDLCCSMWDLCCGMWDLQLQHACGIQFPDQRLNPDPLHWEHGVLPTGPLGKFLFLNFRIVYTEKSILVLKTAFYL